MISASASAFAVAAAIEHPESCERKGPRMNKSIDHLSKGIDTSTDP
jgi:hypothetical protein